MFNQVLLAGRLVRDAELTESKEGNKRAKICLAVQRPFKQRGSELFATDFIYVTLWEGIAELVSKGCTKGSVVIVRGRLEQNNYIDKTTGKKMHTYNVIGERIVFLEKTDKANGTDSPGEELVELEEDPDISFTEE